MTPGSEESKPKRPRKPRRARLNSRGFTAGQTAAINRVGEAIYLGEIEMTAANINGAVRHLAPAFVPELIGAPLSAAYRAIEFSRMISRVTREIVMPSLPDGIEREILTCLQHPVLDDEFLWAVITDDRFWAFSDLYGSCPTADDPGRFSLGFDETDLFIRILRVDALIHERAITENMTDAEIMALVSRCQPVLGTGDARFLTHLNSFDDVQ